MQIMFKKRHTIKEVEEGKYLSPKFDENGLIPVITTDFKTGDTLMHGYMNYDALKKTIETKEAYYWSRSRKKIWHKGQVSGFIQKVKEKDLMMIDNKRFMHGRRAFEKSEPRDLVIIQSAKASFGYGSTTRNRINV